MLFKRTVKIAGAIMAVALPVAAGWAITADTSIDDLLSEDVGHHSIDVYEVDGYEVEREDIDGAVTSTITGPDGASVSEADAPEGVRNAIRDWTSPEPEVRIEFSADSACYVPLIDSDGDWEIVNNENDQIAVARMTADGIVAVYIAGDASVEDIDSLLPAEGSLTDLPGAVLIGTC